MFYGGILAETQPFFVANLVIFSHTFHTLYLLKFTCFELYSEGRMEEDTRREAARAWET
jgi:hypothetical protein